MSVKWFAVDIDVEPAAAEAAEYAFNSLDALGTEIDHLRKSADASVRVTGYFNDLPTLLEIDGEIAHAFSVFGVTSLPAPVTIREVEDRDWLAEWKRHWKPTEVGRFIIAPPWSDVSDTDRIVIRIEPNMAFGTGTHDTTQLCLTAIGEILTPDMSVLDVGTGTGILAIAAAKLGAKNIFACDTDADSVKIARENAVLNGLGEHITFADGPIDESTPTHDLVCANLTIDVIVPILGSLLNKASRFLLLSGILAEQETEIAATLQHSGITKYRVEHSGEWISVVVER